ncbi:hypothetical protein DVJ83_15695 (plasmid) [Deinococcus wulumuqiensis]|uniref:Uncharacterized protein n=1 Tax=Deinococcus wulumuqiensis TaxID=980427 RepID=A0A345ILN5_9DEIO|nr:hypothetical protein DVJ83_15695 [Deinococcus wulumuqiensis]
MYMSRGTHINSGEECAIYSRPDVIRVLWLPDQGGQEVVLQEGLEGEGQWFVAAPESSVWVVRRDFWDEESDESTEEVVARGSMAEAVDHLVARLLVSE